MDGFVILLIIIAAVAVFAISIYNRLVALRQTRKNAFSDIDVQLKQRYNLVPQLVETVKGYAKHESETFENVTEARSAIGKAKAGPGGDRIKAENALAGALMGLMAVVENYPDLKADQNFQRLMAELSDIENKIAASRRFFNSATNEYNTQVQQFPGNLIANMFGFGEEAFFEVEEALKDAVNKAPDVNFTGA
ncbi:MAG: LemA family protein [Rhodospirillales bacterium]|nr:LemA family protein [Rhodospirillales bacterium]MCB9996980.1 LemA family protein [Rhodospirillales bacterium]